MGGSSVQAQHSYYQLLCQRNSQSRADFISIDGYHHLPINHLCMAQKEVLSKRYL